MAELARDLRFFEQSEEDHAKRCVEWLLRKGYMAIEFQDERLNYFTAQVDADLLPTQYDGGRDGD
ncbi:MAG: hypothetical protein LC798_19675 [Chloroflexi bacterium]|nr:hypothetical protein [Chloroflexota bacterium]